MSIHQVIAFAKAAAQSTQDTAVAGGHLSAEEAASAAVRAVEAACVAHTHALVDFDQVLDDPTSTLHGTAHRLSQLATEAAWAAKAVAQALAHEDWIVAREAVCVAREAAGAALAATGVAESDVTDPGSELGREAARRAMDQAVAQTRAGYHLSDTSFRSVIRN